MTTLSVNVPFAGFYESKWSDIVDSAETREIEFMADEEGQSDPDRECYQAEARARLDAGELVDLFMRHATYRDAYGAIARDYVEGFDRELSETLGFSQRFVFEEMTSPRFYNFETDRLFASVPLETVKAWIALSRRSDRHATLSRLFREHFTSRDGFISHYNSSIPQKPVEDWDHNEIGTLLLAVLELRADADEMEGSIYYSLTECDYKYLDKAMDWTALYADSKEAQAEKLEELRAGDPDYEAPLPRCADTLDMFTGRHG